MAKDLNAIRKELEAATGVERSKSEDEQEYLKRIVRKVSALNNKEWDKLTEEAQAWFNDAAKAMNDKDPIDTLSAAKDEDDTPAPRRRASVADEAETPADPEVGAKVIVTLNSGESASGTITEIDEKNIVLDIAGEEEVFRRSKVKSITIKSAAGKAKGDADDKPAEPKVGDTVEVTNAEGEIFKGELIELDEKNVVVEIKGEEEVFRRAKLKKFVVAGKAKAKDDDADDDKPARTRRSRGDKDEGDDKPARTRAGKSASGESDVTKAWKLMAEHTPDATFEQMTKLVSKEGLEVKDNTLRIKFDDLQKHHALFKSMGLLKK